MEELKKREEADKLKMDDEDKKRREEARKEELARIDREKAESQKKRLEDYKQDLEKQNRIKRLCNNLILKGNHFIHSIY